MTTGSRVVMLIHDENGAFGASFPDFPGATTVTKDRTKLHDKARDMLLFHTAEESGDDNRNLIHTLEELKANPKFTDWFKDAMVEILEITFPN